MNKPVYIPDSWVKLKIEGKTTEHKILGGISGGYLDGDSWRINSGVESEVRGKDEYGEEYTDYIGYSGSVYRCYDRSNVVRMSISGVLQNLLTNDLPGITVTVEDLL